MPLLSQNALQCNFSMMCIYLDISKFCNLLLVFKLHTCIYISNEKPTLIFECYLCNIHTNTQQLKFYLLPVPVKEQKILAFSPMSLSEANTVIGDVGLLFSVMSILYSLSLNSGGLSLISSKVTDTWKTTQKIYLRNII